MAQYLSEDIAKTRKLTTRSTPYPPVIEPARRDDMTLVVVDQNGSEQAIAHSARVSTGALYNRSLSYEAIKRDKGLIRRLIRDGHGTPLEYPGYTFYVECPIFVSRQIVKYRLSTINELSGRYSEFQPVYYVPARERKIYQTGKNMDYEFRDDQSDAETELRAYLESHLERSFINWYAGYRQLLDGGVSREMARAGMPVNTYTGMYLKLNLRQVLHFISQRVDIPTAVRPSHGQYEIAQLGIAMAHQVAKDYPTVWEAFVQSGYAKI